MNNNPSASSGAGLDNAVIRLMPIWDTINDLIRLHGVLAAMACMTQPADTACHDVFADCAERLGDACHTLKAARENVFFMQ